MKTLKDFFKDYVEWLDRGAPETDEEVFDRDTGLCRNLNHWVDRKNDTADSAGLFIGYLLGELLEMFRAEGLDTKYPFNEFEEEGETPKMSFSYAEEYRTDTCHLNEKRLAWVRKHAN